MQHNRTKYDKTTGKPVMTVPSKRGTYEQKKGKVDLFIVFNILLVMFRFQKLHTYIPYFTKYKMLWILSFNIFYIFLRENIC